MVRKLLRGLLAAAIVALSVGAATPAVADEAECGVFWETRPLAGSTSLPRLNTFRRP